MLTPNSLPKSANILNIGLCSWNEGITGNPLERANGRAKTNYYKINYIFFFNLSAFFWVSKYKKFSNYNFF